jgi:ParB family chromosome partitioning protein
MSTNVKKKGKSKAKAKHSKNLSPAKEKIRMIPLTELHQPDLYPFRIADDTEMSSLAESVKQFGVREPCLARPRTEGGYELISGNRRKRACELAGVTELPVIVRNLDDNEAIIAMVDSNLCQREQILPSEKAFAYKMKMDAMNHSGVKADKHSCEIMSENTGDSTAQIFRYIRLTELVEVLLDKVDCGELAFTPAVELSFLSYEEQFAVAESIAKHDVKPSLSQAVRLKKLHQAGRLTAELIDQILAEEKKPFAELPKGSLRFRKFFPPEYSARQIEEVIMGLLNDWQKSQTFS